MKYSSSNLLLETRSQIIEVGERYFSQIDVLWHTRGLVYLQQRAYLYIKMIKRFLLFVV